MLWVLGRPGGLKSLAVVSLHGHSVLCTPSVSEYNATDSVATIVLIAKQHLERFRFTYLIRNTPEERSQCSKISQPKEHSKKTPL